MAATTNSKDRLETAIATKLHDSLDVRDIELLTRCWQRQPTILCESAGMDVVLWLVHKGLLVVRVDPGDRIWLETTQLGRDIVRYIRKTGRSSWPRVPAT